jgi:hypothetical protein
VAQPQNLLSEFSIVHEVFNGVGKLQKHKFDMSTRPTEDDPNLVCDKKPSSERVMSELGKSSNFY